VGIGVDSLEILASSIPFRIDEYRAAAVRADALSKTDILWGRGLDGLLRSGRMPTCREVTAMICCMKVFQASFRGVAITAAKYYVFKEGDRWKIRYDGKEYPYDSNSDAVLAAVKAAKAAASCGYDAEVVTQGVDLKWRTEWAS